MIREHDERVDREGMAAERSSTMREQRRIGYDDVNAKAQ
jgi:hypothetical protein